jgi:hypothetical protein
MYDSHIKQQAIIKIRSGMLQFIITDVQIVSRSQMTRHELLTVTMSLTDVNKLNKSGSF